MASPLLPQKTLKTAIECTGVGLHSGARTVLTLRPAEPDHGIVFRRVDLHDADPLIPARWDRVVDTRFCTALSNDAGHRIGTVEHLMSALAGLGVDNALIDVTGPEVPVMDGSAAPFVFLVECAGLAEQDAPRRAIKVLKRVLVEDEDRSVALTPGDGFSISFDIDFENPLIRRQSLDVALVNGTFKDEISRARTFGFDRQIDQLKAAGLAKGGSLDNAVVVSGTRVLNPDGLRYQDEFVRHKVLDCIGDLALAGAPILGHFRGVRSGHSMNNRLLQRLFADASAWRWVEMPDSFHGYARAISA